MEKTLFAPFTDESALRGLRAGDSVALSGTILTGRDAAHKRLFTLLQGNAPLPMELLNQCIYYVGPCPAAPGEVIGPCGPTTSGRMDPYAPALLRAGLKGMIGKGPRSKETLEAMRACGAVYLGAAGGAGTLLKNHIASAEVLAFPELGAEAVFRFTVERMPLIVIADMHGGDLYETGPAQYARLF